MRNCFLSLLLFLTITLFAEAQKGSKVGFIDMNYILSNMSGYTEANRQLDLKVEKWKQEIEAQKLEIKKLQSALEVEKPLLTPELIEDREAEIRALEKEMLDYQQIRFGTSGAYIQQKKMLVKPIQDQIFVTIQDIAAARKYDFIFDKSSDLGILYASKRFDISDYVLKIIKRAEKKEKISKTELARIEKEESELDLDPEILEKRKTQDKRKQEREKLILERKSIIENNRKQIEEKKLKMKQEREEKIKNKK